MASGLLAQAAGLSPTKVGSRPGNVKEITMQVIADVDLTYKGRVVRLESDDS